MKVLLRVLPAVVLLAISIPLTSLAQDQEYYVTIGVFGIQENAIRFTAKANKAGFNAQYAINPMKNNWYYVYLLQSSEKRKAAGFMMKIRTESEYKDAWVFIGKLGKDQPETVPVAPVVVPVVVEKEPVQETPPPVVEKKDSAVAVKKDSVAVVEPPKKRVVKGKLFVFKFLNAENGNEIRGEVHFAETKKSTQYQAFKADEVIDLPPPKNSLGVYHIQTIAPGYKPLETDFHYKDPLPVSSGSGPEGELIIPLSLERAKRGDYIEFNSVSFFRNSVILRPESEMELLGLAELMKEHTSYKIRIHGHCNGTEDRDIFTMGTSTKFFESDRANQKQRASDKELTDFRAETVKKYLVSQGVDEGRIATKGEGGKLMIYPPNSVYANYNDRVEIEVTRH